MPSTESGLQFSYVFLTIMKTTATQERIGRVGRRRQVVIPQEIFENLGTCERVISWR